VSLIIKLLAGAKFYLIAAAGVIAAAAVAYLQIRKDGENAVIAEQAKAREAQQARYDKIDSEPPDLDAAIERMRQRSGTDAKRSGS
jgi:hypothetical protein